MHFQSERGVTEHLTQNYQRVQRLIQVAATVSGMQELKMSNLHFYCLNMSGLKEIYSIDYTLSFFLLEFKLEVKSKTWIDLFPYISPTSVTLPLGQEPNFSYGR